jgi:hypothetical protein
VAKQLAALVATKRLKRIGRGGLVLFFGWAAAVRFTRQRLVSAVIFKTVKRRVPCPPRRKEE